MTEQLKKAPKSVLEMYTQNINQGISGMIQPNIMSLFNSTYSVLTNYQGTSPNDPKPIEYGKTNWWTGDILLFKSYVTITPAEGVEQPVEGDIAIQTGAYASGNGLLYFSNTEIDIDNVTLSSPTILLDSFICKGLRAVNPYGLTFMEARLYDKNFQFVQYLVRATSQGDINLNKVKMGLMKVTLEAEYLGTEQEDGSIIYLG